MTINTPHSDQSATNTSENNVIAWGARLTTAREALGLNHKEAATRLRLPEHIIALLERENYPSDLPITFLRGYLRSYAKLLNIPDQLTQDALANIKPYPIKQYSFSMTDQTVTSNNYVMKFFTFLILIVMAALVITWWRSKPTLPIAATTEANFTVQKSPEIITNNDPQIIPQEQNTEITKKDNALSDNIPDIADDE